jgi:hypothetical protein
MVASSEARVQAMDDQVWRGHGEVDEVEVMMISEY